MNRLTKQLPDGQAVVDCANCELNRLQYCTALACRNRLKDRLADCEDIELSPEDIEQTLCNFSSFLMETTHGRMSKTNYTVQAMVSEANDCFQKICDECEEKRQPEKRARWFFNERWFEWECTRCGSGNSRTYNYCPHCGAQMEGLQK